jgi:hypothetical protein
MTEAEEQQKAADGRHDSMSRAAVPLQSISNIYQWFRSIGESNTSPIAEPLRGQTRRSNSCRAHCAGKVHSPATPGNAAT